MGLHWFLTFIPFGILGFVSNIKLDSLSLRLKSFVLSSSALVLIGFFLMGFGFNSSLISDLTSRFRFEWFLDRHPKTVLTTIQDQIQGHLKGDTPLILADNYSLASQMTLALSRVNTELQQKVVPVWFEGTRFGREFDRYFNPQHFDQKNLVVISKGIPWTTYPYFEHQESKWIEVEGVRFVMTFGEGFRAVQYQKEVIREIQKKFYPTPQFLKEPLFSERALDTWTGFKKSFF